MGGLKSLCYPRFFVSPLSLFLDQVYQDHSQLLHLHVSFTKFQLTNPRSDLENETLRQTCLWLHQLQ